MSQRSPASGTMPVAEKRERTPALPGGGPCMCGVRVPGAGEWSEAGALAACGPPGVSLAGLLDADQDDAVRHRGDGAQRSQHQLRHLGLLLDQVLRGQLAGGPQ